MPPEPPNPSPDALHPSIPARGNPSVDGSATDGALINDSVIDNPAGEDAPESLPGPESSESSASLESLKFPESSESLEFVGSSESLESPDLPESPGSLESPKSPESPESLALETSEARKVSPKQRLKAFAEDVTKIWPEKVWQGAASNLGRLRPSRQITHWFAVDDDRVAEILAAVREQLPTTEALLIGKPQAGKSSIVRGLTGVSADIVGQGFKPHTQHTERYAYPSEDLPLLIFTDTVGLGDLGQSTKAIVEELVADLEANPHKARIFILTVKITDFAIDSLRQIVQALRRKFPAIPCLLVVTSAHEVYPTEVTDHPPYPPDLEAVQRPFAALQESFGSIADRAVLIDFTLEEDGFTPVLYGLEALRDALADLLPAAEAQALYQLLDEQTEAAHQLGHLYRDVGRHYISAFAVMAATLAVVPIPFATMPVLTALQVSMIGVLGQIYGQTLKPSQAGGLASAIAGGFFAQMVGRELIKFVPGFGSVVAASWAAAYTWALGEGACVYFGDLMGGKKPDPKRIQTAMAEAFDAAKERFKDSPTP